MTQNTQCVDTSDRGVSPVVGVILMVAITVILAAVIGLFVLDLSDDIGQSPQAGVDFSENESGYVTVQLISLDNADEVKLNTDGCSDVDVSNVPLTSVGDTAEYNCGSGDTVTAIGVLDGTENVLQTYEADG